MRPLLLVLLLAVLSACSDRSDEPDVRAAEEQPNIVLIVADDLGYGQVGVYPQTRPWETPHIDRLAQSGLMMTQGYSAHPMCWPSRASIMSGRYYARFLQGFIIPRSERLLPQYLKEAGYATGLVGKWHNTVNRTGTDGEKQENHPLTWGFDEFYGFLGGMHDYFDDDLGWHSAEVYMPIYEGYDVVEEDVPYLTDAFTERAVDFIQRHRDQPFFLYLPYNAPHTPFQATEEYLERNDGDVAAAMVDALDTGVGRVLDTLEELGIADNTLVLFVGDNGGYTGTNGELRSTKGRLYEGGIRVPFIASWPDGLPAGQVYDEPVMHVDIMPTISATAGVPLPEDRHLDGKNLLPYWRGEAAEAPHEVLFWERDGGERYAVRRGDQKLVNGNDDREAPPQLGLYDLAEDVSEQNNLIDEHRQIAEELQRLFGDWFAQVEAERQQAAESVETPQGQTNSGARK